MQLDLGSIQYNVSSKKKKKIKNVLGLTGQELVSRTPEEIFLSSQLAPATHSKHIKNSYHLNVHVKHESVNVCSSVDSPSVSIPLNIQPTTQLDTYVNQTVEGFNPTSIGDIKFDVTYH